ncbi:pilin [Candidatus Parcubacteria bacterium]|nr:pilin [Candidatus Parcubacteria bacterium]
MALVDFFAFLLLIISRIVVPLIFAVAFLLFIWGVFQYFIAGGADEDKRKKGREFIVYGIIGFFLMIAIWGIVRLSVNTFGFGAGAPPVPGFGPSGFWSFGGGDRGPLGRPCISDSQCGPHSCAIGPSGQGRCVSGQGDFP